MRMHMHMMLVMLVHQTNQRNQHTPMGGILSTTPELMQAGAMSDEDEYQRSPTQPPPNLEIVRRRV